MGQYCKVPLCLEKCFESWRVKKKLLNIRIVRLKILFLLLLNIIYYLLLLLNIKL